MLNRRLLFLVLACCLFAFGAIGCDDDDDDNGNGGNGGNGGGVGETALNGDVGGSFIQNAEVAVLTVTGDVVATATTDNTGGYTVNIPDDEDGPFLIRVQGTSAGTSELVEVSPDGTSLTQPFAGPWYSLVTVEDLTGDEPLANVTPLTTIAVWMLRAEAAKAGQIDEALLQDYGSMVENMAANAFIAGLEAGGEFLAPFGIYTSPALPKADLAAEDASALVANRAASAIAKDVLSDLGTPVQIGSSDFAGNLAMFGLDLSDGLVDGEVEGFSEDNAAALTVLFSEAVALIPGGDTATDPGDVLTAIETRFSEYTGSDIQTALDNLGPTLTAEAGFLGVATPPAFIVPAFTAMSELVANPPAQMLLILNPAVVEIPAGETTNETATSTLNFVLLDGKGVDVTGDYLEKLSAAVISNGNISYLAETAEPTPVVGGTGYELVTDPFAGLGINALDDPDDDNTATATVRILGTSLDGQTIDGEDMLITFVQPTDARVPTAIESSTLVINDDDTSTVTINLTSTVEPVGQPDAPGVATLTVDNGWFWAGTPDNVSKSLLGMAFVTGEPFDVGYLSPDNVTGTTANIRIDLENNNNITGLASAPIDGGSILP